MKIQRGVEGSYFYWTEKITESETTEEWQSDYSILINETGLSQPHRCRLSSRKPRLRSCR